MMWKKLDQNANANYLKKIDADAIGRNLYDKAYLEKLSKDFIKITPQLMFIQNIVTASESENSTKAGHDMYEQGTTTNPECHWCATGSESYFKNSTKQFYCMSDPQTDTTTWTKVIEDPCTCTKEAEDVNQYGCCVNCCDNLYMYKNNKTSEVQCFSGTNQIDGYTKIETCSNPCPPSKIKPPWHSVSQK